MGQETLYDEHNSKYFTIELLPEGWIYSQWIGEISDEKVHAGGKMILAFTEKTGCAYLINDNREQEGSWLTALDWIENELEPGLIKAGNRLIAHVLSKEFIAKFSAIELEARLNKPSFKIFYELKDAEEWIQSKLKV
jgi:hypothetical protein